MDVTLGVLLVLDRIPFAGQPRGIFGRFWNGRKVKFPRPETAAIFTLEIDLSNMQWDLGKTIISVKKVSFNSIEPRKSKIALY